MRIRLAAVLCRLPRQSVSSSFVSCALMPHALCTSGFVQRRFTGGFVAAALVGLQCLCTSGCQMFRHQGPVSKSVAESRQLSQRGLGAMERGDVDAAEKLLGDAVKACPTDIDARRQYAEALWQSGQRDRALGTDRTMLVAVA